MTTEDLIKLLDDFPEINPSNYGDDEVNALNAWGIAAHTALEALGREVAELKADLKHTEECCIGWAGDFGKANKELEAIRAELAAIRAQEPVDLSRLDPWVQGLGKAVLAELKSAQSQAERVPNASTADKDAGLVADGYPCEIEEADFEANTVTLKMMTSNYQVSAGKYLLKEAPKIGGV